MAREPANAARRPANGGEVVNRVRGANLQNMVVDPNATAFRDQSFQAGRDIERDRWQHGQERYAAGRAEAHADFERGVAFERRFGGERMIEHDGHDGHGHDGHDIGHGVYVLRPPIARPRIPAHAAHEVHDVQERSGRGLGFWLGMIAAVAASFAVLMLLSSFLNRTPTVAPPPIVQPTPAPAPTPTPAPAPVPQHGPGPAIETGGRMPDQRTLQRAGQQGWHVEKGYPGDGTCPLGATRCPNRWVHN